MPIYSLDLRVAGVQPPQVLNQHLRRCQTVNNPKSSTAQSPLPGVSSCQVMMQQVTSTQEHAQT